MKMAVLGCGYVADFYMATLPHYPDLELVGAFDRNPGRNVAFAKFYRTRAFESLDAMLADPAVELVLNLTNPREHFPTTRACLEAGKHVYSEKPLAMNSTEARELVELARARGLSLAAAPCSLLCETAQTLWKAVQDGVVGPVRLVYANFDDGMVHRMNPTRWRNPSGAHWPARDEYEVGCTYEHAGYVLTWLAAIFGPARRVTSFASCQVADKGVPVETMAPDFTVGCIEYANGVVARVTCNIVAPIDKSITIVGENGVLRTDYVRNDASPVYLRKTPSNRIVKRIGSRASSARDRVEQALRLPFSVGLRMERRYRFARRPNYRTVSGNKRVDFLRGPSEQASALRDGRPCRLSPELGLHLVELIETLQYPERFERPRPIASTFAPIEPLPWTG
jgi:predicted dehydrogenase